MLFELILLHYRWNDHHHYVFHGYEYDSNYSRIIFKLVDGKEVKGFDILDDNSKEGRNAYAILKSGVPQNIAFGGNLAY